MFLPNHFCFCHLLAFDHSLIEYHFGRDRLRNYLDMRLCKEGNGRTPISWLIQGVREIYLGFGGWGEAT